MANETEFKDVNSSIRTSSRPMCSRLISNPGKLFCLCVAFLCAGVVQAQENEKKCPDLPFKAVSNAVISVARTSENYSGVREDPLEIKRIRNGVISLHSFFWQYSWVAYDAERRVFIHVTDFSHGGLVHAKDYKPKQKEFRRELKVRGFKHIQFVRTAVSTEAQQIEMVCHLNRVVAEPAEEESSESVFVADSYGDYQIRLNGQVIKGLDIYSPKYHSDKLLNELFEKLSSAFSDD